MENEQLIYTGYSARYYLIYNTYYIYIYLNKCLKYWITQLHNEPFDIKFARRLEDMSEIRRFTIPLFLDIQQNHPYAFRKSILFHCFIPCVLDLKDNSETVECVVSGEFTMSYLNCLGTVFYAMVLWNAARFNLLASENASYYHSITCVYKYTWTP